ncbi:MAG: FkbM family methyltransferase [Nitrospira sp.]|nr:FkbM family methyltransferase [Nitrospira sp.]MBH0186825.1 FkbM family methyltransferase [Nitrospira sp.]
MGAQVGCSSVRVAGLPDTPAAIAQLADILSAPPGSGPRVIDGPFALYGAGKLGRMAMDFFGHAQLAPAVVVDANAEQVRHIPCWQSCSVLLPGEVPAHMKRTLPLVVSVATVCFTELADTLRRQGWQEVVPLYDVMEAYRRCYPVGNGWFMGDLNQTEQVMVEQVLAGWSDDLSRAHHLQFIAWHRLRQDWIFNDAPIDLERRYFIPEVVSLLREQEVFVDVGAHKGEIAKVFRETVNNRFAEILMFEPDARNADVIKAGLQSLPEYVRRRHRLLPQALCRQTGKQPFFSQLGYGSQLCWFGHDMVEVTALDDTDIAPSYLKLHLEGHELDALQGAEKTIRRHRPIIAVTTYHSEAGLWQLPSWLMATLMNYRFYLRLHSWCGTGAVMYCMPNERSAVSA